MRKAHTRSMTSNTTHALKKVGSNGNSGDIGLTSNVNNGYVEKNSSDSLVANDILCDIFRNRKNPINGRDCFFSESTFNRVMGPGPSFEDKFLSQIARIKSENEKQKQDKLNKPKPDISHQKSSPTKVEFTLGTDSKSHSTVVTKDQKFNEKAKLDSLTAKNSQNNSTEMINSVLVSDKSDNINKRKQQNPKQNDTNANILKNSDVSQLTSLVSLLSDGSIEKEMKSSLIVTDMTNICTQGKTMEDLKSVSVTKVNPISSSTVSEKTVNLNILTQEELEKNNPDQLVELSNEEAVNQHILFVSLPKDETIDLDLKNGSQVIIVANMCPNNTQEMIIKSELNLDTPTNSCSIISVPEDHHLNEHINKSTSLSTSEPGCENDTALMVDINDEAKIHNEEPTHDGFLDAVEKSTKDPVLSPQHTNELCLVMPSLSSDDDDDDDYSNFNENQLLGNHNNHTNDVCMGDIAASISTENKSLTVPTSLTGDNADISISDQPQSIPKYDISVETSSSLLHNMGYEHSDTQHKTGAMSDQSSVNSAGVIEMIIHPLHQKTSHAISPDSPDMPSAYLQPSSALTWSDGDVPIFSVKEDVPTPVKIIEPAPIKKQLHNTVKSTINIDHQQTSNSGNVAPNFKKSDLTKAEHKMYLKLYNKYVRPFLQGGPPPVLTEKQCQEISSFEKLQRRVLNEQAEFQNYLFENAKKNPQTFKFMQPCAKIYASKKAQSYRIKAAKYATRFSHTPIFQIPFCQESRSVELRFHQTLLEVGVPPRIKLPEVQVGQKHVPLKIDIQKMNEYFPKFSARKVPGHTHHEPVSLDSNVEKLASKYDFQVVMSSSVIKCLLDNHGPNFDKQWSIPVRVREPELACRHEKVVFLDKPLFENDLHIKDYNALFHKYALRTFVSYPRRKDAQDIRKLFHQIIAAEKPSTLDDPFDMFSNVDDLETFGVGRSKPSARVSNIMKEKSENSNTLKPAPQSATVSKHPAETFSGRVLRSKKTFYKHWDDMREDGAEIFNVGMLPNQNMDKRGGELDNLSNTSDGHRTVANQNPSFEDFEPEGDHKKKQTRRGRSDLTEKLNRSASMDSSSQAQTYFKVHSILSHVPTTQHAVDQGFLISNSSSPPDKYLPMSPDRDTPMSPDRDTPLSPDRDTPMSPDRDTPMSPDRDTSLSLSKETPLSPSKETPLSPSMGTFRPSPQVMSWLSVKEIPLSPVKEQSPAMHARPLNSSQTVTSSPCRQSPRKRINKSTLDSSTLSSQSPSMSETHNLSEGAHFNLFTPLDSILGTSLETEKGRNDQNTSTEDPSHYLPPTEVHSSIVYNLWSLHSVNVLIRTRCHGILKNLKKSRRIYFSPKMEYQTSYGLEQVTVNEMAREWTSCFVRPNTNLLRARINGFSSEIMMLEELEVSQILRSSLNFKPEDGFKFLNRVIQQVLSLKCGVYLLTHESGDNFCGIRSMRTVASPVKSEGVAKPKKKINPDTQLRWIPIDPTILLPHHIANNRIPATFLPKDAVLNFNSGKRKHSTQSNTMDNMNNSSSNTPWKKFKNGKKKS